MRFWEFETQYQFTKRLLNLKENWQQFYDKTSTIAAACELVIAYKQNEAEKKYHQYGQPYYCVWPAIIPMFLKLKLDIDSGMVRPPQFPIALRLPQEQNPMKFEHEGQTHHIRSMLMVGDNYSRDEPDKVGMTLWVDFGEKEGGDIKYPVYSFRRMGCIPGQTIEETINALRDDPTAALGIPFPRWLANDCVRLACGICLMADDPELITPDVLNADLAKWEKTHDVKYVQKAHRRHKIGWHIGKGIEIIPHLRRPHFAWYYLGKEKVPHLIFRKGDTPTGMIPVHRRMLEAVPTGFADVKEKGNN